MTSAWSKRNFLSSTREIFYDTVEKIYGEKKLSPVSMQPIKLPKSLRIFVRLEKARIRRGILDLKEQEHKIAELYKTVLQGMQKKIREPVVVKEIVEASKK